MNSQNPLCAVGARAKAASRRLLPLSSDRRNQALAAIAAGLRREIPAILAANERDVAAAREGGFSAAMLDRLSLDAGRIEAMAAAVEEVIALTDPVGEVDEGRVLHSGISLVRRRVPMGVVGMIYEARPNVTVDAAALCLKTANACILRGGKEAFRSNLALVAALRAALEQADFPADAVQLVEDTSRDSALWLMTLREYVDLLIPRGGAGLIRSCVENATVPVIETGVGNCHAYVDESADLEMAAAIVDNGKTSRPSVCNALETLLVHRAVADSFLPMVKARLDRHGVELRGCPRTQAILGDCVKAATEEDYATEFLDYILAVRVVDSLEEAIAHIDRFSSRHSEVILTRDLTAARTFTDQVDAAAVYVNASTRFTDGGEFGLGAEIGISTQKLHARGPMGLQALTTTKYLLCGDGQIR